MLVTYFIRPLTVLGGGISVSSRGMGATDGLASSRAQGGTSLHLLASPRHVDAVSLLGSPFGAYQEF